VNIGGRPINSIDSKSVSVDRPLIEILLATYNGQHFLAEQLNSIFAQTWINIRVLVNDDGSADETLKILEDYAARYHDQLSLECNPVTRGPCGNFADLMMRSSAGYVAFSDQDDIWRPDKLALCMGAMLQAEAQHGNSVPILIHTDLKLASKDGTIWSESHWKRAGVRPEEANFRNLLAQNLVTGCTMIANRALIDLALPIPVNDVIMHDYWLALIASAFGVLYPIHEKTVVYRQHGGNIVGAAGELSLMQRLRRLRSDPVLEDWLSAAGTQAIAFMAQYGPKLTESDRRALSAMMWFSRKTWLARNIDLLRCRIRRTGSLNHLQFLLRL
jgi:glycosyltransferase involved in cell wall biosynthesis